MLRDLHGSAVSLFVARRTLSCGFCQDFDGDDVSLPPGNREQLPLLVQDTHQWGGRRASEQPGGTGGWLGTAPRFAGGRNGHPVEEARPFRLADGDGRQVGDSSSGWQQQFRLPTFYGGLFDL